MHNCYVHLNISTSLRQSYLYFFVFKKMRGDVIIDHFGAFHPPNFSTRTWAVDYQHIPSQNKHQNLWPRSCKVNKKNGSRIPTNSYTLSPDTYLKMYQYGLKSISMKRVKFAMSLFQTRRCKKRQVGSLSNVYHMTSRLGVK